MDDIRFDVRLVERMISSGALTQEEYRKYLASLPDVGDQAVRVRLTGEEGSETPNPASPASSSSKKPARKKS